MSKFIEKAPCSRSLSIRRPIFGVGINDADYMVRLKINGKYYTCPFYTKWKNMIERCYCQKHKKKYPTYIDCSTSKEWIKFSNFKKWMINQDWKGNELDKDIIKPNNKIYSAENCVFVSSQLNCLLTDHGEARGDLPIGVSFDDRNNKYQSRCSVNGVRKNLGSFNSKEEALKTYIEFKSKHVREIALEQTDERIKNGLLLHSELILNGTNS